VTKKHKYFKSKFENPDKRRTNIEEIIRIATLVLFTIICHMTIGYQNIKFLDGKSPVSIVYGVSEGCVTILVLKAGFY
jgi:hypothetical protein